MVTRPTTKEIQRLNSIIRKQKETIDNMYRVIDYYAHDPIDPISDFKSSMESMIGEGPFWTVRHGRKAIEFIKSDNGDSARSLLSPTYSGYRQQKGGTCHN